MTRRDYHLEVCVGELEPRDDWCKVCLEDDREVMKQRYCYTRCEVVKPIMPLPMSDEELEAEAFANYKAMVRR